MPLNLKMSDQQDQTQNQSQGENDPDGSQPISTEANHFDDLLKEELGQGDETGIAVLSKDDFFRVFCGVFQAASLATGLKSMNVESSDDRACGASGAIYDTIQDVPSLRFLLSPQGKWFQRVLIVGAFAVPMAQAVGIEMGERNGKSNKEQGVVKVQDSFLKREV